MCLDEISVKNHCFQHWQFVCNGSGDSNSLHGSRQDVIHLSFILFIMKVLLPKFALLHLGILFLTFFMTYFRAYLHQYYLSKSLYFNYKQNPDQKKQMKKTGKHIKKHSDCSDQNRDKYQLRERRQPSSSTPQQKSRKISDVKKELLISMVTQQNYRIKEAGRILGISYSTAKKIFTMFRIELRAKKFQEEEELVKQKGCLHCGIIECEEGDAQKVSVVSTLAGRPQKDLPENANFKSLQ